MNKTISEITALVGYFLFFLLAWLIASPILIILRQLIIAVDRSHLSVLATFAVKGLCYAAMIAALIVSTVVALVVSLSLAQRRESAKKP